LYSVAEGIFITPGLESDLVGSFDRRNVVVGEPEFAKDFCLHIQPIQVPAPVDHFRDVVVDDGVCFVVARADRVAVDFVGN
jgi:hypothetical protein